MELSDKIAEYVVSADDFSDEMLHEAKRRLLDSIAVALASINSPPAKILRETSNLFAGNSPLLSGGEATVDFASFYNTLLIRYLDFNDTYLSKEPLHPSDMIGGLLSVASVFDISGEELLKSIIVGYEIGVRLCDSTSLRKKGYDHVNFLQIASTSALSRLLNLDKEKTKNAISLTIVPHIALRESRSGKLSMWKAGATAEAVRNSVFATLLAKNGFTAPDKPFSGVFGFFNIIARDFDLSTFENIKSGSILKTFIKKYPVEYHAEATVEAALKLKYEGEIKKVIVETYEAGKTILADSEDKWNPKNKETADHSLPFITAVTLLTKRFWLDSYNLIEDPKVVSLMKKIEVVERDDYTSVYPKELPTRVIVITDKGTYESEVRVPRGHSANPMSDEEIEEKAKLLGLSENQIKLVWEIENMKVRDFVRNLTKV
ncbi:MmgE/PrpD family protein [Sulfolobus sp. S-194]|uniref:MmgE/PrpD family protein n=1 Tax=Sulfolobus sp. S-194 TaxID=2512240 RepID=UPI001436D136|nr:MmgE/PrpD family protein [Sulfolobus sp. S-194]QIW24728.1 MmgE/PrpD family protein [Sulfolobus sp. S-194]